MKVIFCSDMFSDLENDIRNSRHPAPISGHKFQENLLCGLVENGTDIEVYNTNRIRAFPDCDTIIFKKKKFLFGNQSLGIHIPFINIPILNRITQILSLYYYLWNRLEIIRDQRVYILIWSSSIYAGLVATAIKKQFRNVRICNCIADLHGVYGASNSVNNTLLDIVRDKVMVLGDILGKQSDCFVYLTKYMRDALMLYDKPYCILEALYMISPKTIVQVPIVDDEERMIFYAGSLVVEYGIEHLLKAFTFIRDAKFRLKIAGSGFGLTLIEEYSQRDNRISYLGVIPPSEVAKYQAQATVLVSPRKSTEPFVKYSFPSKTVECLASGTPYVAHRLPCEPPEYADYIQYPDDESDEALARKLEEICNLPEEERRRIGERGREFIAREKNPKVMCKRIVDMWRGMLGE